MIDANLLLFAREGVLPSGSVRVVGQTAPYDHCNLTAGPGADTQTFTELLLSMSYGDDEARPLLDLEGLKQWLPGRTDGYAALEAAVSTTGFYQQDGEIGATGYRP
jgi:ABC-type phosphate/phosphonate transport system substrate-binding protein